MSLFSRFSLLERYIIAELIPCLFFGVSLCSILGLLIGISFEQVRFIVERELPISTSLYIHYLKLPAFIATGLPFGILLGTIISYGRLARDCEIIALKSFGISRRRLVAPAIYLGLVIAFFLFLLNEWIVPYANYQAAITLEKTMGYDRNKEQRQEIIYKEFSDSYALEKTGDRPRLKLLFYANDFDGKILKKVNVLWFLPRGLNQIIIADSAKWNYSEQLWNFYNGTKYLLNSNGSYQEINVFKEMSLYLSKTPFDLANYNLKIREIREISIFECYQKLSLLKKTGDIQNIRHLEVSIQNRYAQPISCIVFVLLGSGIGINSTSSARGNGLAFTIIVVFSYYMISFITTALSLTGSFSIGLGVWLPNLLVAALGSVFLFKE
jgi:lipopolysaccharide export system permease protein